MAQWGNDTEYTGPVRVSGHGVFPTEGLYDAVTEWEVTCEYANGVTLICKSGSPAIRFEGDEGWVACTWSGFEASSPQIANAVIGPEEFHPRTCPGREQRDFLDCVKTRSECYAPAEIGHRSITLSHLGNIAMMVGRTLRWNPDTERCVGDDTANRLLSRAMRAPWRL